MYYSHLKQKYFFNKYTVTIKTFLDVNIVLNRNWSFEIRNNSYNNCFIPLYTGMCLIFLSFIYLFGHKGGQYFI